MSFLINNLYQMGGTATIAQQGVAFIAQKLGFKEISMGRKDFYEDYWNMISHHQDGCLAPLYFNDIVVFQYPSWNGPDYDKTFINKIRLYKGTKLIIWVHDLQALLFPAAQDYLIPEINLLNQADLLILPSTKMADLLHHKGLRPDLPIHFQKIWDIPGLPKFTTHTFKKRLLFTGNFDRFPFLIDYHGSTPLEHFDGAQPIRKDDECFHWRGFLSPTELLHELSLGGFGLVWADEDYFDRYYCMNQPHKLGFDLAAGIPVIVKRGCVHSSFVETNGLGLVVDSLAEADTLIQNISEEAYQQMVHHIIPFQTLLLNGAYTTKLLLDAIILVAENNL